MAIKDRLIQFILRGRDELSPEARKSTEALEKLKQEANQLGTALDNTKATQGLVKSLEQTGRAVEQTKRYLEQAEKRVTDLQRSLAESPKSQGLRISLREAEREAARTRLQLGNLEKQLRDAEQAAQAAGVDTRNLADEQRRLAGEVERGEAAIKANAEETRRLTRELNRANREAAENAARVGAIRQAVDSAGKRVLAFAAAYVSLNAAFDLVRRGISAVTDGVRSMLDTADRFEGLQQRLTALMGSVEAGENAVAWIKRFAKETPLELDGVTEAFMLLKSYGLDPMDGTMQAVTDTSEKLGGGLERLQGISTALGQAWAKQKLQQEEILQLVERGVPVWDMLERVTGRSVSQLQEMSTAGRLGRDVIRQLIEEMGRSSQGAAAAGMSRLSGMLSTLSDTWSDFLDRVGRSGALDYVKDQLNRVVAAIDEMDRDGRLDRLARSLSDAFVQGVEKAKEFAAELGKVDFKTLVDDASTWFSSFGKHLDDASQKVSLFILPFRALFNGITSGLSVAALGLTNFFDTMLAGMEKLAKGVPEAMGGKALRKSIAEQREALKGFSEGFKAQIEQDGKDLEDAWRRAMGGSVDAADAAARAKAEAARKAAEAEKAAAQEAAAEQEKLREALVRSFIEGKQVIVDVAKAVELIQTAKTRDELVGLRSALETAYRSGTLSMEEFGQAQALLNQRLRELGGEAGHTGSAVKDLAGELKDLASVQRAIASAQTDVDLRKLRTAIGQLYREGALSADDYNRAMQELDARQKQLKGTLEQGTKAQAERNKADKEAIVTSEQLRRESGKRMEAERRAGDEAMQRRRKESSEAKKDMSGVADFFSGVLTRAREPLAAMSAAALEAFDRLRGISTVKVDIDTSSLEATQRSLGQVVEQLGRLKQAAAMPGLNPISQWMIDTQVQSLKVQEAFLSQKGSLQSLMRSYEKGTMNAREFVAAARSMARGMSLLDESDLSALESAIASAEQRMKSLGDSTRSTLESLQDELDNLMGRTEDVERRRFAARRRELEAQLAEAQAGGDSQAIANAARALGMLRQIEAETEQKRLADQQKARQEEQARAKESSAPARSAEPAKIIRLEVPGRQAVEVGVNSAEDETRLLDVLEAAGLRSLS